MNLLKKILFFKENQKLKYYHYFCSDIDLTFNYKIHLYKKCNKKQYPLTN